MVFNVYNVGNVRLGFMRPPAKMTAYTYNTTNEILCGVHDCLSQHTCAHAMRAAPNIAKQQGTSCVRPALSSVNVMATNSSYHGLHVSTIVPLRWV